MIWPSSPSDQQNAIKEFFGSLTPRLSDQRDRFIPSSEWSRLIQPGLLYTAALHSSPALAAPAPAPASGPARARAPAPGTPPAGRPSYLDRCERVAAFLKRTNSQLVVRNDVASIECSGKPDQGNALLGQAAIAFGIPWNLVQYSGTWLLCN
jgi:hypothetical protein